MCHWSAKSGQSSCSVVNSVSLLGQRPVMAKFPIHWDSTGHGEFILLVNGQLQSKPKG